MMTPIESASEGSLEESRGDRALVPATCQATITLTALHHYQGRNCDILAWAGMLALTGTQARRWEPSTLRHRLMTIPAVIAHHARRTIIRYKASHPWTELLISALERLRALACP